jgi:hypothetical protein
MTIWIGPEHTRKTTPLLVEVLRLTKQGEQVQFLCDPGVGEKVVQRMRVTLSRSRVRNRQKGRKIDLFTLHHCVYPFTDSHGKRHDCVVMWTSKSDTHRDLELLDDLMERA